VVTLYKALGGGWLTEKADETGGNAADRGLFNALPDPDL
jgi:hypothetical protein